MATTEVADHLIMFDSVEEANVYGVKVPGRILIHWIGLFTDVPVHDMDLDGWTVIEKHNSSSFQLNSNTFFNPFSTGFLQSKTQNTAQYSTTHPLHTQCQQYLRNHYISIICPDNKEEFVGFILFESSCLNMYGQIQMLDVSICFGPLFGPT